MRNELKYAIYLIGLGMSLVVYAHTTFATKHSVESLSQKIEKIDHRIYEIWTKVVR